MKTYRLFSVVADPTTGEWCDEPWFTGKEVAAEYWHSLDDTEDTHFDTYEHSDTDSRVTETRALMVHWEDEEGDEPYLLKYLWYDFREGQIVELFHERPQAAWEINSAPDYVLRNVIAWAERSKEYEQHKWDRLEGDISAMELVLKHIPADRLAGFLPK